MRRLDEFLNEPLGRSAWLALGAVMVFVGLHEIEGVDRLLIGLLALGPLVMLITDERPRAGLWSAA